MIFVVVVFILLYRFFNRGEAIEKRVYLAIVAIAAYILIYRYLPPRLPCTSIRLGQLYEYLPALSLGLILFPGLNASTPEKVTIFVGWCGLILVSGVLLIFKLFIW